MALAQHNPALANQTLQALRYQTSITKATIYRKDGIIFATYMPGLESPPPSMFPRSKDFEIHFLDLSLVREIMDNGERVGTIVIQATLEKVLQRWIAFGTIVGRVIFASSLFSFLVSNRLQALISDLILRLTSFTQRVSSEKNYSLREAKNSQDEIGTLIDGVSDILEPIQHRDRQLQKHQEELEELVTHRTTGVERLHRRVELILKTAGEGIIGLDHQGHTTFVSAAASHMLGCSAEELEGPCLHNCIHHKKADGSPVPLTECPLHHISDEWTNVSANHDVFWQKNGTPFPVEYKSAPIRDDAGRFTGVVMTFRDVTEQIHFEAALLDAVQSAEHTNQAKSRFLATMSHEIPTPMNGLLGMSELLLKTPQTPKQRPFTESLHRSGRHLLHIINDILDFSKIEAEKLELETLDFPLHQTIKDTVQLFAEPAQKKGLELICHIESTVPSMAQGDLGGIRQILTNLIRNAIKFTTQGETYIRASVAKDEKDAFELQVEVLDTGIGIPSEAQSKIFEAFSQADDSTTRRFGGPGLGLTITKGLVGLMGGQFSFLSEAGKGSTFIFTVSLQKGTQSNSPGTEPCLLQGLRILLVENNRRSQLALNDLANRWGVHNQPAHDGEHALNFLNQHLTSPQQVDAVFIDHTLPDMDGIDLAERIQANFALASIPLILLTPWHMTEEQGQRASLAGLHPPMLKPVRQSDLYDRLRALRETPQEPVHASSSVPSLALPNNLGSASVLLAEDHEVNQEIVKVMADYLNIHLEVVSNGLEAMKAIAKGSFDLILMGWQRPEMDGLEATREIRKREALSVTRDEKDSQTSLVSQVTDHASRITPHVPTIAITAHASPQDRVTCLEAGTDDVLAKPFSLDQFLETLGQWLPTPLSTEAFAQQAQPIPHVATPLQTDHHVTGDILDSSALDQSRSLQRPNTPSIVGRVLTHYLINTPKLLADLLEGLRQAETSLLQRAAHTLKSSSANVGAIRLSKKCKEWEHLARSTHSTLGAELLVQDITAEYETVRPILVPHCTEAYQ